MLDCSLPQEPTIVSICAVKINNASNLQLFSSHLLAKSLCQGLYDPASASSLFRRTTYDDKMSGIVTLLNQL